ncbi:Shikimate kinase [Actibacterium lipolyticum]|uniref:Shikimate kinase n=2 Tax=Actibacterium lipolyticum TaxID=1524263 RepID=A0A238JXP3_9RHOB|nr:shikimate kinase [Actibacterium lipolyticum]SMX34914.1 Shikimate kinase [Actibacterium lipolyticum]
MGWKLKKTVVMVGMMGAGKTAVGTNLAKRLAVPFLDSDEEIEKAADRTIAEIFSRDGEAFFRRKEAQVISRLLESEQCILSTGGGAYLSEDNRAAIADKGVAVWLKADIDLLWNRVRHKTTRPLLNTGNPEKTLRDIYDARVPYYEKCDLQVQALPRYSIDQMTDAVIDALLTRPDVLEKD